MCGYCVNVVVTFTCKRIVSIANCIADWTVINTNNDTMHLSIANL